MVESFGLASDFGILSGDDSLGVLGNVSSTDITAKNAQSMSLVHCASTTQSSPFSCCHSLCSWGPDGFFYSSFTTCFDPTPYFSSHADNDLLPYDLEPSVFAPLFDDGLGAPTLPEPEDSVDLLPASAAAAAVADRKSSGASPEPQQRSRKRARGTGDGESSSGSSSGSNQGTPEPAKVPSLSESDAKREKRMAKNRESASLSRKRKKEYLDSLELKVASLSKDKEVLMSKVRALEADNRALRARLGGNKTVGSVPLAAGTTLMACLLCVGFMSGASSQLGGASIGIGVLQPDVRVASHHSGRTLQAFHNSAPSLRSGVVGLLGSNAGLSKGRSEAGKELGRVSIQSTPAASQKPSAGADKLDEWLEAYHEQLHGHSNVSNGDTNSTELMVGSDRGDRDAPLREGTVFRLGDRMRDTLFNRVERRTDYSYAFCSEVQMVAADKLPTDGVPRMSLVVPALHISGKTSEENRTITEDRDLSLLQIDCSVDGTRVINSYGGRSTTMVDPHTA